eukprot:scaffold201545_cov19-Tisochrysis_lutea.AAC.2
MPAAVLSVFDMFNTMEESVRQEAAHLVEYMYCPEGEDEMCCKRHVTSKQQMWLAMQMYEKAKCMKKPYRWGRLAIGTYGPILAHLVFWGSGMPLQLTQAARYGWHEVPAGGSQNKLTRLRIKEKGSKEGLPPILLKVSQQLQDFLLHGVSS